MESIKKAAVSLLASRALSFLREKNYQQIMDQTVDKKIRKVANITLGKELVVSGSTKISDIPFTSYELYKKYYESPAEAHFLYNLNDYLTSVTSGTMGRPKKYLVPKKALQDNLSKTAFASLLISSHDGEKVAFEIGDNVYTNIPGGSQIAALLTEIGMKMNVGLVKNCPDPNLPFQTKVDYFIDNHMDIDMAYMTVTTLLDEVYPRIGEPFHLKGFMTQDVSASVFKDEIKKVTGSYPKTTYGSTETLSSTVASIENPGSFIFDWRIMYAEFIPEKDSITVDGPFSDVSIDTVSLSDVEPGKRYQLVATPYLTELTRYAMPDLLECVDTGDDVLGSDLPSFKYYARADRLIVLHNFTRIAEEELLSVLKESGVPFVDFTAVKEYDGAKEHMKLYLELSEPMEAEKVYRLIDERLTAFDRDWHDLKRFLKFSPLRIELLPKGSFKRYMQSREGMTRIERIGMKKSHLGLLLSLDDL